MVVRSLLRRADVAEFYSSWSTKIDSPLRDADVGNVSLGLGDPLGVSTLRRHQLWGISSIKLLARCLLQDEVAR